MNQFNIIKYMGSMTGFTFPDSVLERIALERGVSEVENFEELTDRDRDLLLADMLFVIYTTPTQTASLSKQHGGWQQSIGSQTMTDKRNIYDMMMKLYGKWGDDKLESVAEVNGGLQWLD